MAYPTASALERVDACPGSHVLPQAKDKKGPPARRGTALHTFIQLASDVGREKALAIAEEQFPEHVLACELLPLEKLPTELDHEVAFAYDIATGKGRVLGRNVGRNYSTFDLAPTEYVGTADLCGVSKDSVLVGDYKSGHGHVTRARENLQTGMLCVAAAAAFGKPKAHAWIVSIKEETNPWFDRAELDEFDLADIRATLRALPKRIDAARARLLEVGAPDVKEGEHCRYCPAFNVCPAKRNLALAFSDGTLELQLDSMLTPAKAAQAYHRLGPARQFLARIEKAIYSMAKKEPIDLGNGKMLGEIRKLGNEKLDGQIVFDVMKEKFGPDVAHEAVELRGTKKRLKIALRAVASNISAAEEEVLKEVRERGGGKRKWSTKVAEYPSKELDK